MTMKAIISEMKDRQGITAAEAERQVKAVFDAANAVIFTDKRLAIPGFGTFNRKFRDQRTGRNPSTGETLTIPAREVTTFKESKSA